MRLPQQKPGKGQWQRTPETHPIGNWGAGLARAQRGIRGAPADRHAQIASLSFERTQFRQPLVDWCAAAMLGALGIAGGWLFAAATSATGCLLPVSITYVIYCTLQLQLAIEAREHSNNLKGQLDSALLNYLKCRDKTSLGSAGISASRSANARFNISVTLCFFK